MSGMWRALALREIHLLKGATFSLWVSLSFFALLGTYLHWMDPSGLPPSAVACLLALFIVVSLFLSSDILFQADYRQGILEELKTRDLSFIPYTMIKGGAFMAFLGLPLALMAPSLLLLYGVPLDGSLSCGLYLWLTLLFATMTLLGSALTLGATHQKSLMFLFLLPFYIPLFLVAQALFTALLTGRDLLPYIKLLGGLTLIDLPLSIVLTSLALQQAASEVASS